MGSRFGGSRRSAVQQPGCRCCAPTIFDTQICSLNTMDLVTINKAAVVLGGVTRIEAQRQPPRKAPGHVASIRECGVVNDRRQSRPDLEPADPSDKPRTCGMVSNGVLDSEGFGAYFWKVMCIASRLSFS